MPLNPIKRRTWRTGLLALCLAVSGPVWAQVTVRPELLKPLQAAQEALNARDHQQALNQLTPLLATPSLTPAELGVMLRLQAVAAMGTGQWELAISTLQRLLSAAEVNPADRRAFQESLMNAAQQQKDYPLLIQTARQYLQEGGTNPSIRPALIQALALTERHAELVEALQEKIRLDTAAGHKTPENQLRLMAVSYRHLKDQAGYNATLRLLLASYPKPEYWAEAVARLISAPGFNNRYELDAFRLLEQTGNVQTAVDFTEMAGVALRVGLPAEALRVLRQGFEKGVLGQGAEAAAHQRLRAEAEAKVREDDKGFAQLEKSARDGNTLASVADVHASRQDWAQAQAVYARALAAGGLRREQEVRLHQALSLFKGGDKAAAQQALKGIEGDATAVEIAGLWALLMQ